MNSNPSPAGKFLKCLADLGMGLVVAASVSGILASVAWYFELATHFMVYLFLLASLVSAINLFYRRWRRLLLCGAAAIFTGIPLAPFVYPRAEEARVSVGRVYSAVLLNLRRDNKRPEEVVAFLSTVGADLVLLQEVTPDWERRLRPVLTEYPHEVLQARDHAFGIWLLSRRPLGNVQVLPGKDASVPYVVATVDMDGKPLRLVGVHPVPPTGRSKARDRNDRLGGVGEDLRKEKAHRMILGDLNCTPWSPHFRRLLQSAGVLDTGVGRGLHSTWFPGIPLLGLPIDHCLVSPSVVVVSRTIGPDVGSDHRPLTVEFSLAELPAARSGAKR